MKTRGVKYVIGLFGVLGALLVAIVVWQLFGNPTVHMPGVGHINPPWIAFTLFVAAVLLLSAFSLSRTTSRWAWALALLLNVLLLGSVLILPLLIASLIILLKRTTREHFEITKRGGTNKTSEHISEGRERPSENAQRCRSQEENMKRSIAIAGLMLAGLLCASVIAEDKPGAPPYDKTISDAEALDIAETTFRYQFTNNASGAQQNAKAYFLSLFTKDPSPSFLKRFSKHKPPVKNVSEFEIGKGLKFRVNSIRRLDKTKVEVSGGYFEGGLSSSGCTYTVELKDKKWVVTQRKMKWIS